MNEACSSRYSGGAQVNKCSLKTVQDSLVDIDVLHPSTLVTKEADVQYSLGYESLLCTLKGTYNEDAIIKEVYATMKISWCNGN